MPKDDLDLVVVGLLNELISLKGADYAAHRRIDKVDMAQVNHATGLEMLSNAIGNTNQGITNLTDRILTLENRSPSTNPNRMYFYVTDTGKIFSGYDNQSPIEEFNSLETVLADNDYHEISVNTARAMSWPLE